MKIDVIKINWTRIEQGLSITELCNKSLVSKSTVSRLLKEKVSVRPDTVGKIAKALNIPVKDLYINE